MNGAWNFTLRDLDAPEALRDAWLDLQGRAEHSFFQSWAWVGTWLGTISDDASPGLIEATYDGRTVALSVLGRHQARRQLMFSRRALLVNESGVPEYDDVMIEHNGLLMERGLERDILPRMVDFLVDGSSAWDELHVSGVDDRQLESYVETSTAKGLLASLRASRPYFYVDLASLRRQQIDYLETLSRNTRYQIRRSMRKYEGRGGLAMRAARDTAQAMEFFSRMRDLHQSTWHARGFKGAFSSDFANAFHERLIESRHEHGEVQLVEASAAGEPFGYLYNFSMDGVVSNYQSGFRYESDPQLKPGLVSHALAIDYNLQAGARTYDFLAGDQRFKRSLSTHEGYMAWLILQREGFWPRLESRLRALRAER